MPAGRGYLIADFQGRRVRTVSLPRGRSVLGRPAFNATGTRLWFLSGRRGRQTRLHVVRTSGASAGRSYPVDLRGSFTTRVFVSPGEDRVAIGNTSADSTGCGAATVLSVRGSRVRRLSAAGNIGTDVVAWSARSRLAYALNAWRECGRVTPSARLFVTSRRAARPDTRIAAQQNGWFGAGAWAPDSRRLAFPQCDGGSLTCSLVVIDVTTGRRVDLGGNPYPTGTVWAREADEIVTMRGEPELGIWAFDPETRRMRRLSDGGDIQASSADGGRIVIYRGTNNRGVLTVASRSYWPFPPGLQRRLPREGGAAAYFVR